MSAQTVPGHQRIGRDSLAQSDPACPIITAILRVVPVSRWAFARPDAKGKLAFLLGSQRQGNGLAELQSEALRQRERSPKGPRIAATIGPLGNNESGVTLLFADGRADVGTLVLVRTSELGPFTSNEIAMLTLALDVVSERLSALRLNATAFSRAVAEHSDDASKLAEDPQGEQYVLDRDLRIVMTWTSPGKRRAAAAVTELHARFAERLPALIENTVRGLVAGWQSDPATQLPGLARPVFFLVVRTQPVSSPAGLHIGVRIDRFHPAHSLVKPAARFHISPREIEVLTLLLGGAKLDEIGKTLNIAVSTVQDHIKSMVDKTESRNRTELIARMLGWDDTLDLPLSQAGNFR
jgi:DNA-binding CsgD family transcriptional regulator